MVHQGVKFFSHHVSDCLNNAINLIIEGLAR